MNRTLQTAVLLSLSLILSACQPAGGLPFRVPPAQDAVIVRDPPGPYYEIVFSIPVGPDGVQYRGFGIPEMLVTGPNALSVLPDGSFVVADLIDNRLLHYDSRGQLQNAIHLDSLDIVNVSDMQTAGGDLYLKEISGYHVTPARNRIIRLSPEGRIISSYDIPDEFRLADNLPGIGVDGDGRILFDSGGGLQQLVDAAGAWAPAPTDGYAYHGQRYRMDYSHGDPAIVGEGLHVRTRMTMVFGSLQILGGLPDGRFYVIREDLVSDNPFIRVDLTVHLLSADGRQLGVARYPLDERLYHVDRALALGPDGYVYAMLPQEDSIHIVRLNFYSRLEPLIPGAAEPVMTRSTDA